MQVLDGFKTLFAGVGSIAAGAYLINEGRSTDGMELIFLGLGLLGLAHKGSRTERAVREIEDAVKASPPPPAT